MVKTREYLFILIMVAIFAYLPSFFGGFIWDDEDFVTQNIYVQRAEYGKFFTENAVAGRGKSSNYFRPLQFSLYALIHSVAGFNPFIYHAVTILLHALAGCLLFVFLKQITNSVPLSLAASLIFLTHPVQTEAVAYISGLSDPLSAVFLFGALALFVSSDSLISQSLVIGLFILSLLAKEPAMIMAALTPLILIFFPYMRKRWKLTLLIIGIACAFLFLRMTVWSFQNTLLDWENSLYATSISIRLGTFFRSFFTYIGLVFAPFTLFMERDASIVIEKLLSLWTFMFVLITMGIAIILYLVRKHFSTPQRLIPLFFWTSFLASMIPFSGIILLNGMFYEHFLYLPLVFAWSTLLCFIYFTPVKKYASFIVITIVLVFICRSWIRQYEWINPIRFYTQTLVRAPTSVRILNNLGMAYADAGETENAENTYRSVIRLSPNTPNPHHNLANLYLGAGRIDLAETEYLTAIRVSPRFRYSHASLINLYLASGQEKKALTFLTDVTLKQFPRDQEFLQMQQILMGKRDNIK